MLGQYTSKEVQYLLDRPREEDGEWVTEVAQQVNCIVEMPGPGASGPAGIEQVAFWLGAAVGLPQYASDFRQHHIDGDALADMDQDVLKNELGISSWGHRRKIYLAISGQRSLISRQTVDGDRRQEMRLQRAATKPTPPTTKGNAEQEWAEFSRYLNRIKGDAKEAFVSRQPFYFHSRFIFCRFTTLVLFI